MAAGELQSYRTDDIAEDFKTKLDPDPGIATCVRKGALLKVPLSSGNTITSIAATDSNGDQAMVLIYETVRDISELPYRFFNGVKIKVAEDTDLDTPGYFVEFVARDPDSDGFDPALLRHQPELRSSLKVRRERLKWLLEERGGAATIAGALSL